LKISRRLLVFSFIFLFFLQFQALALDKDYKQMRSGHFIITYHKDVKPVYITEIKNVSEKFYRVITQEFNFLRDKLWLWENRAKIFVAKDRDSYKSEFNCSDWSAACVSYRDKTIYTYPEHERFKPVFAHELTHIIFREYVKENNFPLWLDEGVAVYVEEKYGGERFYKHQLYKLKKYIIDDEYIKIIDLSQVNLSALKDKPQDYVSLFYLESFSIVNFLMKEYGKFRFSQFVSCLRQGYSLEKALSKVYYHLNDLAALEKRWKDFYS